MTNGTGRDDAPREAPVLRSTAEIRPPSPEILLAVHEGLLAVPSTRDDCIDTTATTHLATTRRLA